jgi:predicted nuclease with TOPRIM domain
MTNVIPFAPRRKHGQSPADEAEERAALAADLIEFVASVREMTERVAALRGPSLQVEHTAQNLLDAGTALERALEALTEDGEWVPF